MNDSTKTPAQLLAAVLRVVAPRKKFVAERGVVFCYQTSRHCAEARPYSCLSPTSKDDLARVVAMLTPEQVVRYNLAFAQMVDFPEDHERCDTSGYDMEDDSPVCRFQGCESAVPPDVVMTAKAEIHLAALVAATGVKA